MKINLKTALKKDNNAKINHKIFLIQFNIIFISIFLISYSFVNIEKNASNRCLGKFIGILPRTNLKSNNKQLKSVFKSRKLFINDANITNEYIRCIRPLTKFLDNKNTKLPKNFNKEMFNASYFKRRKDQLSFEEFCKLCINEKLINQSKNQELIKFNKPFISVIVAAYNKGNLLLKSIRSIQNQSLKNIEIIIVNDGSTDNSEKIFEYLLKTDPRIRVFKHLKNLGLWRTRVDGFLYSNAKYVIHFDCGDLYYDNYVLEDLYILIEKYKLDSIKSIFRIIKSYNYSNLKFGKNMFKKMNSSILFIKNEITKKNIYRVLKWSWGVVWNRLILSNIYTKGLYLLSDRVLNIYKNLWEDIWWNKLGNKMSNNLLIVPRYGYLYYYDGKGEGTIKLQSEKEKDKTIKEFIYFLYFDYDFLGKKDNKSSIIKILFNYDKINNKLNLTDFRTDFYILNDLLKKLINDPYVDNKNKTYLNKLLDNSLKRQNEIKNKSNIYIN